MNETKIALQPRTNEDTPSSSLTVTYLRMYRLGTEQAPPFPRDSTFLPDKRRYRRRMSNPI